MSWTRPTTTAAPRSFSSTATSLIIFASPVSRRDQTALG
jgi:hypothetical protein